MFKIIPRRTREAITIGHDVVVAVLEVKGQQVRIGIKAPKDVPVHREEIVASIPEQQTADPDHVASDDLGRR